MRWRAGSTCCAARKIRAFRRLPASASWQLALWLQVDALGLAVLILAITVVWMAEFVNAAVEAAINLSTSEFHPMAKVGKDVASAAVLLGVVASILIGILVLGPPLLHKLGIG